MGWPTGLASAARALPCAHDKYTFGREIGRGAYGRVYHATCAEDGASVAIKVIPTDSDAEVVTLAAQVCREVESLMRACDSEHVLRYLASHVLENELWIVTELCEAGSLLDIMRSKKAPLDEPQLAAAITAALSALRYLHDECLMLHRDVKAGNLLLSARGELRLADFGVAVQLGSTMSRRTTAIGTPHWMAPEVIAEAPYASSADIWSLGITAIELAQMNPPHWELKPALRALFKIPSAPPPLLSHPEAWSALFPPFLASCLFKEADARLSAAQLLQLPFCVAAGSAEQIRQALRPLAEEKLAVLPSAPRVAEAERRDTDRVGGRGGTLGLGGTFGGTVGTVGTIGTIDTIGTFGTVGTLTAGAAEERAQTLVRADGGHTAVRTLRGGLVGAAGVDGADEGTLRPGAAAHLTHTLRLSEDVDGAKWSADEGTLRLGATAHTAGGGTLRYGAAAHDAAGDDCADTGGGSHLTRTLRLSDHSDGAEWSAEEGTLRPGAAHTAGGDFADTGGGSHLTCTLRLSDHSDGAEWSAEEGTLRPGAAHTAGGDCADTGGGSHLTCTLRLSDHSDVAAEWSTDEGTLRPGAAAHTAGDDCADTGGGSRLTRTLRLSEVEALREAMALETKREADVAPVGIAAPQPAKTDHAGPPQQEAGSPAPTRLSARTRGEGPSDLEPVSHPSNLLLGVREGAEAAGAAVARWASERLEAVAGSGGIAGLKAVAGSETTVGSLDADGSGDTASSLDAAGSLGAASSLDAACSGDAASSLDAAGSVDAASSLNAAGSRAAGGSGDAASSGGAGLATQLAQTLQMSETRRSAEGGASGVSPGSHAHVETRRSAEGGAPSSGESPGSHAHNEQVSSSGVSPGSHAHVEQVPNSGMSPGSQALEHVLTRGRSYAQVLMCGGALEADEPQLAAAIGDEDCVRLVMCTLRMHPWDGSRPFESVPLEGAPMTPWLVGLCELVAEGGPPTLLSLLLRMLTDARTAADCARRAPAAPSPVPRSPAAAGGGRRRGSEKGGGALVAGGRGGPGRGAPAGGPAGEALSAAFQAELRVQRVVLKALLIVARAAPSSAIFRNEALQETLFGLALTHDAEVRLLAVQVLRELADADADAARFMCSPGALQGVVALCGSAINATAPSQHGASSLLCTLELLETLLSSVVQAGHEAHAALPAGLGAMLATVESQTEPGSATNKLARNLRAHLGLSEGGAPASVGLDLLGRRGSFGDAMGGWLNRAFPSPGGANKRA